MVIIYLSVYLIYYITILLNYSCLTIHRNTALNLLVLVYYWYWWYITGTGRLLLVLVGYMSLVTGTGLLVILLITCLLKFQ
jgi:hypothetical protein